jgi:hypothetical protein
LQLFVKLASKPAWWLSMASNMENLRERVFPAVST